MLLGVMFLVREFGKGDLAELAEWRKQRKWWKHRKFCLGEQVQH